MNTLDELLINQYNKIVLSKPTTTSLYKKIVIKRLNNSKTIYQAEQFTATQVLHKNFDCLNEYLSAWISSFREIYLFGEVSYAAFLKNGEITRYQKIITENNVGVANHNKEKKLFNSRGVAYSRFC